MNALVNMVANTRRTLQGLLGSAWPNTNTKHDHYTDFGYPDTLDFMTLHKMYTRNGIANAGLTKTVRKTWESEPYLLEQERDGSETVSEEETTIEKTIRQHFTRIRAWAKLADADLRSMVGTYAAVILRIADGQPWDQPVKGKVSGGIAALVELIPVWEGQLTVATWDQDPRSPNYGLPLMYNFNEAVVNNTTSQMNLNRAVSVHPDRVLLWSKDGTLNCTSALEPGYNDLVTMEKIAGAGGEGFWKNAKAAPVLQIDKEAKLDAMAKMMGTTIADLPDKMNDQVAEWQKGFDELLMIQGMEAKTLSISLPIPEHFFAIALQGFAASLEIPMKILVGTQTGERASTEDAAEWNRTIMSRRSTQTVPNIMILVDKLVRFGMIPPSDWFLDWDDLTEASALEKMERALKMAEIDAKVSDEWIFTPEEIREAAGYEPLTPADAERETETPEELAAAAGLPAPTKVPKNDARPN